LVARIECSSGASAFSRLFSHLHETLVAESLAYYSGTTATIALIDANTGIATVAHAGDSTLMVASGRDVDFVSHDHKVEGEDRLRVLARGGEVRETVHGGVVTARVCSPGSNLPGLAMARALGDQEAHALGVICKPEICTVPFRPNSVLVVASDGVWDKATQKDVALYLDSGVARDVQAAARGIVARSREMYRPEGDIDDITAIVVRARPRRTYSPAAQAEAYSPGAQTRATVEAPKRMSRSTGVISYV
jgi:serine/threonine protein phosphatase PrpC